MGHMEKEEKGKEEKIVTIVVTIVTVYFPTDQLTIQWHGKYMQQLYTINYDLYVLKLQ